MIFSFIGMAGAGKSPWSNRLDGNQSKSYSIINNYKSYATLSF